MKKVCPQAVLEEIANAIPKKCKKNIIIIGSLAAGYNFFTGKDAMFVRTKDADCLLSPHLQAVNAGKSVAEQLLDAGWQFKTNDKWKSPGKSTTKNRDLPAVRLFPPGRSKWFIELLAVPKSSADCKKEWIRLKTKHGYFGLCTFRFLSLTDYKPLSTEMGISIARPEMMVLANMLEHPKIGSATMSALIASREIKRSNKDLGRVLAIAHLSIRQNEDILLDWPDIWKTALQSRFPNDWLKLAHRAGSGLRKLLDSRQDLDEAHHTCINGLLASNPPTLKQLQIAGARLLKDAVEPLEKLGN